jgi:hypothetical protein
MCMDTYMIHVYLYYSNLRCIYDSAVCIHCRWHSVRHKFYEL